MSLLVHILLLAFGVALARNCTKEDWLSQYTECSLTENKRDLIYYKNPDTDECSGGEAMPSSIFGLSCDVTCKPGYRLPRGAQECEACPAGQYTLGGGIVVTKWDNVSHSSVLPFRTYATDLYGALVTDPGTGWYTDPGRIYLRSGKIKDAQNSILEVTVHVK